VTKGYHFPNLTLVGVVDADLGLAGDLLDLLKTPLRRIGHAAPAVEGMAVFGPAPAPLAMLRGRHRQRLLVHASRSLDVQDVIRDWLAAIDWSSRVRVAVDVDPYSFL
jgi:primosomal protein N' (replication factor Y)